MKTSPLYSVVVPVYNSEQTLEKLFERTQETFSELGLQFEMVFVNDCSRDGSWKVLEKLKKAYPEQVTAIHLAKNFGQHNALMCGFNQIKGDFVVTIDDDLQIPPEEITKLIQKQNQTGADVIYGIYDRKKHNLFRNFGSSAVQLIFRRIFQTTGNITAFRLIKSSLIHNVRQHRQSFVFIDGLLHWHTQFIERELVRHEKREFGRSGYSIKKLLLLTSNLLFNFTTYPLRLLVLLGTFFSVSSFMTGMYYIFRKIFYDVPLGYTSTIVAIFFSSGILLLVIGVVGEYIGRIYSLQNDKPQFSVRYKAGSE